MCGGIVGFSTHGRKKRLCVRHRAVGEDSGLFAAKKDLVAFPASGGEEAVINFQHKGGEAGAVVGGRL